MDIVRYWSAEILVVASSKHLRRVARTSSEFMTKTQVILIQHKKCCYSGDWFMLLYQSLEKTEFHLVST